MMTFNSDIPDDYIRHFEKVARLMLGLAGTGLNPALTLNFIRILRKMGDQ